jgi:hypothetical protein
MSIGAEQFEPGDEVQRTHLTLVRGDRWSTAAWAEQVAVRVLEFRLSILLGASSRRSRSSGNVIPLRPEIRAATSPRTGWTPDLGLLSPNPRLGLAFRPIRSVRQGLRP